MKPNILDSSSASDFLRCERLYYFSYVRGWRPDRSNTDTLHGSAMHDALDELWLGKSVDVATETYTKRFEEAGLDAEATARAYPKNPDRAQEILAVYLERYGKWLEGIKLLHWEMPFAVAVLVNGEKKTLVGRFDKVYEEDGYMYVLDHKTTKSMKDGWSNQWLPNLQVETYDFVARKLFGSRFKAVVIDGLLFQVADRTEFEKKNKMDATVGWLKRIYLEMNPYMHDTYQFELRNLFSNLEFEHNRRNNQECGANSIMEAFPRRTNACHYYGGCPYRTLCYSWRNPEKRKMPLGFKSEFWQPFDLEELKGSNAKEVIA